MKMFFCAIMAALVVGALAAHAQDATWGTVSVQGICIYQIPPTVELEKGTYKKGFDKFLKTIFEIETSPDRIIAQPKGINDLDPVALNRYCRVIVETTRGSRGSYSKLDEPPSWSAAELKGLDIILRNQMQQTADLHKKDGIKMTILSWQPTKIVLVNGAYALLTTYTRSVQDDTSVLVHMYKIENNDCLHTITISYRESESAMWAEDLGKVIGTFKFKKR